MFHPKELPRHALVDVPEDAGRIDTGGGRRMNGYEAYCMTDLVFYDAPAREDDTGNVLLADHLCPDGWSRTSRGYWTVMRPDKAVVPAQGWKVHVAATPAGLQEVLEITWAFCIEHRIPFKYLRNRTLYLIQNTKYADRRSSGKVLTLYPRDDVELELVLRKLGAVLAGHDSPYILSDLRWEGGPLYVRYGSFLERTCRADTGELVSAIEDPDGELVPDERQPVFQPPAWAPIPEILAPAYERFRSPDVEPFPYVIDEALHFSNGGGVYRATDPHKNETVVLKEARPFAGLDGVGADAVSRLERERRAMEMLAGLDCVPRLHEYRAWWEHHYLVVEHIEAETLSECIVDRMPLLRRDSTPAARAAYTDWALHVLDEIDRGVTAMHERGVVFGDLHPRNVLVRPDDRVAFVDFELASHVDEAWSPTLGDPGFTPPAGTRGFDADRYAVGCLRLAIFLPLTSLLQFGLDKVDQLLDAIETSFPVPPSYAAAVRRETRRRPPPGAATRRDRRRRHRCFELPRLAAGLRSSGLGSLAEVDQRGDPAERVARPDGSPVPRRSRPVRRRRRGRGRLCLRRGRSALDAAPRRGGRAFRARRLVAAQHAVRRLGAGRLLQRSGRDRLRVSRVGAPAGCRGGRPDDSGATAG